MDPHPPLRPRALPLRGVAVAVLLGVGLWAIVLGISGVLLGLPS